MWNYCPRTTRISNHQCHIGREQLLVEQSGYNRGTIGLQLVVNSFTQISIHIMHATGNWMKTFYGKESGTWKVFPIVPLSYYILLQSYSRLSLLGTNYTYHPVEWNWLRWLDLPFMDLTCYNTQVATKISYSWGPILQVDVENCYSKLLLKLRFSYTRIRRQNGVKYWCLFANRVRI